MGSCKNLCTIWQTLNEPYGRIVSVQVTTWETWSDRESLTSLHTPDVSLFSHMFMTVKAILWDYVHHMRDPNRTMSAMWIYKLPWETLSDLASHYICFEFVIRVMGKCFVMNHAGRFQCSKEITWTCCHQKRKYCHFVHCQELLRVHEHCSKCTAWLSICTGSIFHFQYTPIDRG